MKRALLLGGTGAMGVYLTPELIKQGYTVDITTRRGGKAGLSFRYIVGDAKDDTFLKAVLQRTQYDVVVDFMVYSTKEFQDRIDMLLQNTGRYVFLSTYRVFANNDSVITEKSPKLLDTTDNKEYLKTDEYALTKARQENILRSSKRNNWTIVRPSITYSKERFQLGVLEADTFLYRVLTKKRVVFPVEMLDKYTTMTWAGDVARMIAKLLLDHSTLGDDFNVVTGESRTWREVLTYYRQAINIKVKYVKLNDFLKISSNKYQILYDRMFDRIMDNTKVLKATGMKQEELSILKTGLQRELESFLRRPNSLTGGSVEFQEAMDNLVDGRLVKFLRSTKPRTKLKILRQKLRPRTRLKLVLWQLHSLDTNNTQAKPPTDSIVGVVGQMRKNRRKDGLVITLSTIFNYGSIIQRYALKEFLRKKNYAFDNVRIWDESDDINQTIFTHMASFVDKYIGGEPFNPKKILGYRNYIVGSDQVWRNWFDDWSRFSPYFLNFLGDDKKATRISYAASFGVDNLDEANIGKEDVALIKPLLNKFNAISVREESGVRLVNEIIGNKKTAVKVVLDPVFLLEAEDYSRLIDNFKSTSNSIQKVFGYILDFTDGKRKTLKEVSEKYGGGCQVINPRFDKKYEPVEEWLRGFRDCRVVVTDSFHGVVLSIINNKDFIAFNNADRGSARFTTLLRLFDIDEERLVTDKDEVNLSKLRSINWDKVNKKLTILREESGDWLLKQLKEKR